MPCPALTVKTEPPNGNSGHDQIAISEGHRRFGNAASDRTGGKMDGEDCTIDIRSGCTCVGHISV